VDGLGRCLKSHANHRKALKQPVVFDGIEYEALEPAPVNINIQRLFIQNIDFGDQDVDDDDEDSWKGPLTQALQEALAPYGQVIKITVPTVRLDDTTTIPRQAHVFLNTPVDNVLPRDLPPLRVEGWMLPVEAKVLNAPPCGFCRQEGHGRLDCPSRLRLICNSCRVPGHLARDCARFGERDQQIAAQRELGFHLPTRHTNTQEAPRPHQQRPQQSGPQEQQQQQQQQQQQTSTQGTADGFLTQELEGIPPITDTQSEEGVPQSPPVSREQSPAFSLQQAVSREQSPEGDFSLDFFTQIPKPTEQGNNKTSTSSIDNSNGSFVRDSMEGTNSMDGISSQAGSIQGSLRSTTGKRKWGLGTVAKRVTTYLTGFQSETPTQTQRKKKAGSVRSVRSTQTTQSTRTTRSAATTHLTRGKGNTPY